MNLTTYLIVFLVAVPVLGAVSVGVLILARRWGGRSALWTASALWWAWLAWTVVGQDSSIARRPLDELALIAVLMLCLATIPAYFVDRASAHAPLPRVWKRMVYGIGGFYVSFAIALVAALLVLLATSMLGRVK